MSNDQARDNGAQSLIKTLVACGVDVCFMNPGTSEMHFVAALDAVPQMRSHLCLFEGVLTGAADGYARMTDKPAATLLHLGPGLTNAQANVHNARRAHSPMVNVVGDHATYHKVYDAPLNSDVDGIAKPLTDFMRTTKSGETIGKDTAEAVAAALTPPGQISTLILPADVSWGPSAGPAKPIAAPERKRASDSTIKTVAEALRSGEKVVLLLGGMALRERGLIAANRVGDKTGARVMCDTFPARMQRGAGMPSVQRMNYFAELAALDFQGTQHLVLVGTKSPAAFFAYPGKPSDLVPEGCKVHTLANVAEDAIEALEHLAEAVGAPKAGYRVEQAKRPDRPQGKLDSAAVATAIGALMPENAIVADEGNTEGIFTPVTTVGAPAHDWLFNTGGSIGLGLPMAAGAAVACPGRKVICLEGDGSAMYTIQSLWTMARYNLDVTTILFANRSYKILNIELMRVGAEGAGQRAKDMLDISRPDLDFVALARGMGVDACRPETAEAFTVAFERAMREPGPHLIECLV
jgi:acetolactate synthase I/II/III large subunit